MASRAGRPNKYPKAIKEMIVEALHNKGGAAYLERQADENPSAFLTLVGKVLPLQIQGDKDAPITITVTRRVVGED